MILALECLWAQCACILSFVTVNQLMLGKCTRVVECLLTHKTLNYRPAATTSRTCWWANSQCPRLTSLHDSRFGCRRWQCITVIFKVITAAYHQKTTCNFLNFYYHCTYCTVQSVLNLNYINNNKLVKQPLIRQTYWGNGSIKITIKSLTIICKFWHKTAGLINGCTLFNSCAQNFWNYMTLGSSHILIKSASLTE